MLHLVNQPALDGFGERNLANVVRALDARPHRGPPRAPVLLLVLGRRTLRRVPQLLIELLRHRARVADRVNLSLHLFDSAQGLWGFFEYATDLFDAQTIERMSQHWQALLEGIVSDADHRHKPRAHARASR